MGIFDDAIREHLELKRQLGADEDELKDLEDEAFGLPERPDAENPTGEARAVEAVEESEAGEAPAADAEAPVDAPSTSDGPSLFDGNAEPEAPPAPAPEAPAEENPAAEIAAEPEPPHADEPAPVAEVVGDEEPSDPEMPIPPSSSETGEFLPAEEPQTGSLDPAEEMGSDSPSFSTTEREAIADQPTVFFDQTEGSELDVGELDLSLDDEAGEMDSSLEEPVAAEDTAPTEVAPVLEDEPAVEVEDPEVQEPELEAEDEEPVAEVAEEPVTGDEDVLEETPEFLRDNPDDDELWFEQGEPKDFDF